jgi:hypothetical protein
MIILKIYVILALFYGLYAIKQHLKYYSEKNEPWRLVLVYILNVLLMPYSIVMAYKHKVLI